MRAESSCHCSVVGSTPVGLCAQACSKIVERSGIFYNKTKTTQTKYQFASSKHMLIVFKNSMLNAFAYGNVVQRSLEIQATGLGIVIFVLFHI